MENKSWIKPPIKGLTNTCPHCASPADILPLDTKIYNGFGGWSILKNGSLFFIENKDKDWDDFKDLAYIETLIGNDEENEYTAKYYAPLRDALYQRHTKDYWVLIEQGLGFA